ncbi:hypothetical protein AB6A40_003484 [Gnathostoma spinigerum]|uniref:Fibronectin type-III domain-containing protein n=1 Tax=Gnathostoma spinigerum TaxID=75299 RepID=A0ABD6E9P8_9BILA
MILGAVIFQAIEGPNLKNVKKEYMKQIDTSAQIYTDRVWQIAQSLSDDDANMELVLEKIRDNSKVEFDKYVENIFTAYRTFRHGYNSDAPSWDFLTSLFFTVTMLTSIGYGYVAPFTFCGRLFGVIYCLIGIPLTLVTVTNIAKFLSEALFFIHFQLWQFWIRWRERSKCSSIREDDLQPDICEGSSEQEILDRMRLIRFPSLIVFCFVFFYGLLVSYIVQAKEQWTYIESMYFTFISILTVGFGDYRPGAENQITILIVILGGMILTTMCVDVFGRMYLEEIHYLGRKLQTTDPFHYLRRAKAHRHRQIMATMLQTLAKGMIFSHVSSSAFSRRKKGGKGCSKFSGILPDQSFMFARLPPDPPRECQVVSTSAYSVRLAWAPAFSADENVTYNIRYRLKHKDNGSVHELTGIQRTNVEITNVDSCSLYEFRITAKSRYGESKPVFLVQYTEPQLSPQHILATKLNANSIELTWEPPYKKTHLVKNYIVYYTDDPNALLSEWDKVTVNSRHLVFPDLRYDWFYMFCATACFADGLRSPLSRALYVKTDKLEFQRKCVGHSKTIGVMSSVCDDDDTNATETSPLIRRDVASFGFYG